MSVIEDVTSPAPRPQPIPVRIGATRAGPSRSVVLRKDPWWVQPLVTGLGLLAFVVYATWAAFRNGHYFVGLDQARNYLSPFYSPCLAANCPSAVRWGPDHAGELERFTPAIIILIFPLALPAHLLLLPQDLLPGLLALAAGLCRRGCRIDLGQARRLPQALHRRDALPARPPEHPPLLLVLHVHLRRAVDL